MRTKEFAHSPRPGLVAAPAAEGVDGVRRSSACSLSRSFAAAISELSEVFSRMSGGRASDDGEPSFLESGREIGRGQAGDVVDANADRPPH